MTKGQLIRLQKYISESKNIVFFGGAGVSTESGIPDFRSKDGLYNQHNVQLCAQLRVCSQAGGIPVYPRFSQPDNSESWDDAGNGI